jgi:hypothetical protein
VANTEPERLSLELQLLLQRRSQLRKVLESALMDALTEQEEDDLHRVLDHVDTDIHRIQQRLDALRKG